MSPFAWIRQRCTTMCIPSALLVERERKTVVLLDDPRFHEMFWFAWRITPIASDEHSDPLLKSFWDAKYLETTTLRCKTSGAVVDSAFWPLSEPIRDGRLILRGAYAPFAVRFRKNPVLWIQLLLFGRVFF